MCVHTKCAKIQKKMGILLDEETIQITVSEFRSRYERNSVSRSDKFKDIKILKIINNIFRDIEKSVSLFLGPDQILAILYAVGSW